MKSKEIKVNLNKNTVTVRIPLEEAQKLVMSGMENRIRLTSVEYHIFEKLKSEPEMLSHNEKIAKVEKIRRFSDKSWNSEFPPAELHYRYDKLYCRTL